jgi:single-strand DNA-binding protein
MRVMAHGSLQHRCIESRHGEKRTVIELAVDEVGPSLRYATTKVTRSVRSSQADGDDQDVWAGRWDGERANAH